MTGFADVAIVAAFVVAYALVSRRLSATVITGPILFVGFGVLGSGEVFGFLDFDIESEAIRLLAEFTLALLLFSDASRIDVRLLRRNATVPARMLGIGMPLVIAIGTAVGLALFPAFGFWEAALLAAILAPTDAALGQAVVTSPVVPPRLRQAINVESGLNDGIAVPFVALFLAGASTADSLQSVDFWATFAGKQIGLGVLTGAGVALAGGYLVDRASHAGWLDEAFSQIGVLGIAVFTFALADVVEGNGFIAVFTGGVVAGSVMRHLPGMFFDFAEQEGQLLALLTFLVFGAVFVGPAASDLDWRVAGYALLSLTVVRVVPIALSLLGTGFRLPSVAFLAWFGPRGLASIVFGLLVVDAEGVAGAEPIFLAVTATVLFSVVLHGVTAEPAARAIARYAATLGREAPELGGAADIPGRHPMRTMEETPPWERRRDPG